MAAESTFESLCFNSFLAKDYLNDSNQDPDINFCNDIYSMKTSYLLPCEANNKLKRFSSETFSVLQLNIRSMTKNFESFKEFYNSLNIGLSTICLSVTWVNYKTPEKNLFQLEGYNPVHQIRKNRKGGGIAIFTLDSLLHKIREDLSINCDDIDSLSIEIIKHYSQCSIQTI